MLLGWHPLRSMPLPKAAESDPWIRPTSSMVKRPPNWISVNLGLAQGGGSHVFSLPDMKSIGHGHGIFCFLKGSSRWSRRIEVKATSLIRRWGHWAHLSHAPVTTGSPCSNYYWGPNTRWIAWLLKISLKSLNTVASTSHTSRIGRNHWWCNWTSRSSSRTVSTCKIKFRNTAEKILKASWIPPDF